MKLSYSWKKTFFRLTLCVLLLLTKNCLADTNEQVIRVGVVDPIAPFIIKNGASYAGITMDVWQFIASNEHLKYEYIPLSVSADEAAKMLQKGDFDVLIGPFSVTSERYKEIDFSYPYFLNSVGIIENIDTTDLARLSKVFLETIESPLFIGFILLFIIYIHIFWLLERGRIQSFHANYFQGISHILWTHLLQKGYKEIPYTFRGRLISLLWVISAAIFATAILAMVTSKLTLALVSKPEHFTRINELQGQFISAVKGTHAYREAKKTGANVIAADNIDQAIEWLDENKVAAVAEDYILAKEYLNKNDYPKLHFSSITLSNDQYAIAVQKNSPLLAKINKQILAMEDDDSIEGLCSRYIGADSKLCKL